MKNKDINTPDIRANREKQAKKRKKGQPTDQYKYGVDVPNSEDEQPGYEKWAGGDNISLPIDWEDNIKKGKTSKDMYDSFISELFLKQVVNLILEENNKSLGGSYYEETYKKATVKNLMLDKQTSHGGWPEGPSKSFTSDEPVNKQIINYLRDMGLLA